MMQGKKLLAAVLPLLLIGVFLFLTVRDGYFLSSDGSVATDVEENQSGLSPLATRQEAEDSLWGAKLPQATVGSADGKDTSCGTDTADSQVADILDSEVTQALKPSVTEEDCLPVMLPGQNMPEQGHSALVTEFKDASIIELPQDSTASGQVWVTGFPDTLPLALPQASPMEPLPSEGESASASGTVRAVYVASVYNLDFPSSSGLSASALRSELEAIVNQAASCGLNTLFFQVRPASDALYESVIFPTSRFVVKQEGAALPLDPLAYLIQCAHAKGIAVHAWLNPFRVTLPGESIVSLSPQNPARLYPELTYTVSGQVYYDPSQRAVDDLIACGVAELCARYDIDGILFDDYFYPADVGLADAAQYNAYRQSGGALSLSDWRRENVNRLIRRVYQAVKALRPECLFGVSPRGIWRNSSDDPLGSDTCGGAAYDEIYCDALAWVKGGYIDYLSPQIYWSFDNAAAPFATLADWWNNALANSGIELVVSLASYYLPPNEIDAQKAYLATLSAYGGYALYRYGSLA